MGIRTPLTVILSFDHTQNVDRIDLMFLEIQMNSTWIDNNDFDPFFFFLNVFKANLFVFSNKIERQNWIKIGKKFHSLDIDERTSINWTFIVVAICTRNIPLLSFFFLFPSLSLPSRSSPFKQQDRHFEEVSDEGITQNCIGFSVFWFRLKSDGTRMEGKRRADT